MTFPWFINKGSRFVGALVVIWLSLLLVAFGVEATEQQEVELDYVFADFQIDNRKTDIELELATKDYLHYFLALADFNAYFVADFSCDHEKHQIAGQFWHGRVELSLVPEEEYFIADDLCYLNIEIVKKLDIRMKLDLQRQIYAVLTKGKHPQTREIKIAERKKILETLRAKKSSRLDIKQDYQFASAPLLDFTANTRWINNDHRPNLFAQGVFDLLYHQTDAQINWQEQGEIRGRANLKRKLKWNNTHYQYQLGDIQASRQSLFNVPSRGLGVSIGEQGISRQRTVLDLNGYTQPFSEVELYKDDLLVDFLQLQEDGFYEFKNVDFQEFDTQYHIRINTPDGHSELVKVEQPGSHGIMPGKWQPAFVYLDSAKELFNNGVTRGGSKLTALDIHYALSTEELLSVGLEHNNSDTNLESNEWLAHASVTGLQFAGFNFDVKAGYSDDWVYDAGLSFGLGEHNLGYSHNRLINGDSVATSHGVSWGYIKDDFSASVSATQSGRAEDRTRSYSFETGYRAGTWSISFQGDRTVQRNGGNTNLGLGDNQNNAINTRTVNRNFAMVASLNSFLGSANLSYRGSLGNFAQRALDLSLNTHLFDLNTGFALRWDLERKTSSSSVKFSKTLEQVRLNGNIGYDTQNGWNVGMGVAFSLSSRDPFSSLSSRALSKSASVYMLPYLDTNNNLEWDADEAFLPQIALLNRRRKLDQHINDQHIALFGVKADQPQIYTVDDSALDNPYIEPQFSDINLEAHAGSAVHIELPFHVNFELEGQIQLRTKAGDISDRVGQVPLHLYLLGSEGKTLIRTYHSEPDGYYVLDRLKSGHYLVKIDVTFLERRELQCQPCEFNFDTNDAEDHLLYMDDMTLTHSVSATLVSQ